MQVDTVKEGLVIPYGTLHDAKSSRNVGVKIRDKGFMIKEKNITRRMRGYCGKLRLSTTDMKDIYSDGILKKYEK